MPVIRPLFPGEASLLAGLDTSFTTEQIYHVHAWDEGKSAGFELLAVDLPAPLTKTYDIADVIRRCEKLVRDGLVLVADDGGRLVGVLSLEPAPWNRTVHMHDLYVQPEYRGQGCGRNLVEASLNYCRGEGARALAVETQNVNYAAVQFYRALGFRLSGIHDRLYASPKDQEVALFFQLNLEGIS